MAKKRSKLKNYLEYIAVRAIIGGVGLFRFENASKIGIKTGVFLSRFLPRLRKTAYKNFEIALPGLSEKERQRLLKGTFESLGRQLGLVANFKRFTPEELRRVIEIEGREHFEAAHSSGKGVLCFTGHFGSWEVFNLLPQSFGYSMNVLVRRIDNPLVEGYVESLRTRFGGKTLDKTTSARKMFRLLAAGEKLGIVADLNSQEREGIFVDFFGIPASTTTSLARLALKTDAIVLPVFAVWDEKKRKYVVHIEKALEYAKSDDIENDVFSLTQGITSVIEDYVKKFPEQWMWIHKRWNTRPKGEPPIY